MSSTAETSSNSRRTRQTQDIQGGRRSSWRRLPCRPKGRASRAGARFHSWRATANGLEGVADRTSDIVLILDELGQLDARDAATSLYMLAGGAGKIRINRDATLKDIRSWRAFIMSSGEMTVETKMTSDARREGLYGRDAAPAQRLRGSRAEVAAGTAAGVGPLWLAEV